MLSLGFNKGRSAHLFDGEAAVETWIGQIRVDWTPNGTTHITFDLPRHMTVLRDERMRQHTPDLLDEVEEQVRGCHHVYLAHPHATLHVFDGFWSPTARIGGVFFGRIDGKQARVSTRMVHPYLIRPTLAEPIATQVATDYQA